MTQSDKNKFKKSSNLGEVYADVIVIGAGAAGMPAAAAAAEKEASVIVIEKQPTPTRGAAIVFAAETQVQRRADATLSKDEAFQIWMDWNRWNVDAYLIRTVIDRSSDYIQWIENKGFDVELGVPMYNYFYYNYTAVRGCHSIGSTGAARGAGGMPGQTGPGGLPGGKPPVGGPASGPDDKPFQGVYGGGHINKVLKKVIEDRGGKFYFNCKAEKILTGAGGEVTGVLARMNGKDVIFKTRNVILATGGYSANKELMAKYHPSYSGTMSYTGGAWLTGDGIMMASEAGAALEEPGKINLSSHGYKYEGRDPSASLAMGPLSHMGRNPHAVWVNKMGERFCNDWLPDHGNTVYRQPEHCLYALFDEKVKSNFVTGKHYSASMFAFEGENCPPGFEDDLRSEAAKGNGVKIAGSWAEIAKWIGVDPDVLENTVNEYNTYCDKGYDPVFNKKWTFLDALRTPPFYAIKCHQDFHGTWGTIKINHRMEVLSKQFRPIRGLYACGDTCGGWVAEYCIRLNGFWDGFCAISGKIAGENAAENIKEK